MGQQLEPYRLAYVHVLDGLALASTTWENHLLSPEHGNTTMAQLLAIVATTWKRQNVPLVRILQILWPLVGHLSPILIWWSASKISGRWILKVMTPRTGLLPAKLVTQRFLVMLSPPLCN